MFSKFIQKNIKYRTKVKLKSNGYKTYQKFFMGRNKKQFMSKIPYFVLSLVLIKAIIYKYLDGFLLNLLAFDTDRKYEIWRFLTYTLVNDSFEHAIGSILNLLYLGIQLEHVYKWRAVCSIYFAAVLAGSFTFFVYSSEKLHYGSYEGINALGIFYSFTILLKFDEMKYVRESRLLYGSWIISIAFEIQMRFISFLFSRYSWYHMTQETSQICAAISGLLIGVQFLELNWILKRFCLLIYISSIYSGILYNFYFFDFLVKLKK